MSSTITRAGEGTRTHLKSNLMRESLVSRKLESGHANSKTLQVIPDCNMVFIGGQSIFDRGAKAVLPLVDHLIKAREKHKFVVGVGAGARLRHLFDVGLDLGLPTGGLAMVAGAVCEQNSRMLWTLLANSKAISMNKENFLELPVWLQEGMIPILSSMPPYHFWEPPSGVKRIPMNGQDIGLFLFAELLGAKSLIFVKDEDGLYTNDPKKDSKAEFIPEIGLNELLERRFEDLILEKDMLMCMRNAKHVRKVQIINGLKPELLERALNGEHVGTIIDADK